MTVYNMILEIQYHSHQLRKKKCFSCRLSLRKRQEMKFSRIEQNLGRSHNLGYLFSPSSCYSVLFLAKQCNSVFSTSSPLQVQSQTDYSVLSSGRFFYIFLVCCKMFVMVVIKVLFYCCVADKWHSVCENYVIVSSGRSRGRAYQSPFL